MDPALIVKALKSCGASHTDNTRIVVEITRQIGLFPGYFLMAASLSIFFLHLVLWMILKRSVRKLTEKGAELPEEPGGLDREPIDMDEGIVSIQTAETRTMYKRYYLHLLSVLQREGRLVDFLMEDLSPYPDEQIGAAVRAVQEQCRKVLVKYISPRPVTDGDEGDSVTVDKGFDPAAVRLTGNVSGDPPYHGILRHKGWRAGKVELPEILSAGPDPHIIAPAEVEIP